MTDPNSKKTRPKQAKSDSALNPDIPSATSTVSPQSVQTSLSGVEVVLNEQTGASLIGRQFGRYQIERELGHGAMGEVYLAQDTQLGRQVALKLPKASVLSDPDSLDRFYREARTAATLRHPNICPIYDVGMIDGSHYLSMAYIPGKPVSEFLKKGKLPAQRQVALLIRKISAALVEAHELGIVHRDLKPSNVMLDVRGEPIVMDFGLARRINTGDNARITQSGAILGTPAYMSPEQVQGDPNLIGPGCDIYSLGVMFYQFLTGQLPFQGPMMMVFAQIISQEPPSPSELRPDVDPELERICLKMMAKEIPQRYSSMREVVSAITDYIKSEPNSRSSADLKSAPGSTGSLLNQRSEPLQTDRNLESAALDRTHRHRRSSVFTGLMTTAGIAAVASGLLFFAMNGAAVKTPPPMSGPIETAQLTSPPDVKAVDTQPESQEPSQTVIVPQAVETNPAADDLVQSPHSDPVEEPDQPDEREVVQTQVAGAKVLNENSRDPGANLVNGDGLTGWSLFQIGRTAAAKHLPISKGWKWENGEVVCTKDHGQNHTWMRFDEVLGNFEISLEFKLPPGANTGVFVRYSGDGPLALKPDSGLEIQLEDVTAPVKPLQRTGALYGVVPPSTDAFRANEWNSLVIRCYDDEFTVTLNEQEVVNVSAAEVADLKSVPHQGYLGFSNWNGRAAGSRFRNIRLQKFETSPSAASDDSKQEAPVKDNPPTGYTKDGWYILFDGTSRHGWKHYGLPGQGNYQPINGVLKKVQPEVDRGILAHERSFKNFVAQLQYRLTSIDDSLRFYFRLHPHGKRPPTQSLAVQLMDNRTEKFGGMKRSSSSSNGALRELVGPADPLNIPFGQWHTLEVRAVGPKVTVKIDSKVVLDGSLKQLGLPADSEAYNTDGVFGIQNFNGQSELRDIRVQELDDKGKPIKHVEPPN